jgi:hypothetical protein
MMGSKIRGMIAANLAVIAIALASFSSMSGAHAIYPFDGMVTDARSPSFEWTGPPAEYELLLDDDPSFSSPMVFTVRGSSHRLPTELDFGTYFWKVKAGGSSTVARSFTVVSTVSLSHLGSDAVINSGNTNLLVHGDGMSGAITLAVNESLKIPEEGNVNAEQDY